jgi:hypothetical protein
VSWAVYLRNGEGADWVQHPHKIDEINISDTLNERSTANVTIVSPNGTLMVHEGMGIQIERDDEVVFKGFVSDATESRLGFGGSRTYSLACIDMHYLVDKRVVTAAYQDTTAGDIVKHIRENVLASEGIREGVILPGPTLRAISFNYQRVSDVFQELATRAGFWWAVNPDKTLDFTPPLMTEYVWAGSEEVYAGSEEVWAGAIASLLPPIEVDIDEVAFSESVALSKKAPGYRNRQWIKGGRDRTTEQTETQHGDGEQRSFLVGFPIAQEPTVEVSRDGGAFTEETVGVAGLQEGRQWQWSFSSNTISQDTAETVLGPTDRVRVTYIGLFDVMVVVDDGPEQANRQNIDGGTGIVENVIVDRTFQSRDAAFQMAGEMLAHFIPDSQTLRFTTTRTDYYPGQVHKVTLPGTDFDQREGLVTTVEHFSRAGRPHAVVTVISGPQEGSWEAWLGRLSQKLEKAMDPGGSEVEVITILEPFLKEWTEVETPNIFRETRVGTAKVGSAYPEFLPEHRVRYLSWFYGGVELGRKPLTHQSGADTNEIVTTVLLVTSDALGDIDEFGWWGGHKATAALGTGVEIDRRAYVHTKTDIEQIQTVRTDRRWE